jgi:diketogulonate reductase-like aldo/keto reductase
VRSTLGKSVLALAVRWVLDQGPTVALWGARHPEQLAPIRDALGWHIDEETLREIDRILLATVTDPIGPDFMAPPARRSAKALVGKTTHRRRAPATPLS